ncbi:uncharacterized protein LOC121867495 isoform X2 [Homarus americanus]|nr:uncharacterized protein LOC121867495 isoform X2 [Homarus americanus]
MMAPPRKEKDDNSKEEWMRRLESSLAREVANLRDQFLKLEKKKKFLQGEALQHQVKLSSEELDFRTLGPKNGNVFLRQEHLQEMKKRLAAQKLISLSELSEVQVDVERVLGMDEVPGVDEQIQVSNSNKDNEAGVVKKWKLEGKVGEEFAYSANFFANYNVENPGGVIKEVTDLRVSSVSDVVKKMMVPERAHQPTIVRQFTSDLYYLKMLHDEREDTARSLQMDIPNLEVVFALEPMELTYFLKEDYEVKVLWAIVWDSRNNRLKYSVAVDCKDEVTARFSRVKEVFPFLSGRQQLETRYEFVMFKYIKAKNILSGDTVKRGLSVHHSSAMFKRYIFHKHEEKHSFFPSENHFFWVPSPLISPKY